MLKSNNNCEEISTYILLFLVKIYIIKMILLLYLFKKQLFEIKKMWMKKYTGIKSEK